MGVFFHGDGRGMGFQGGGGAQGFQGGGHGFQRPPQRGQGWSSGPQSQPGAPLHGEAQWIAPDNGENHQNFQLHQFRQQHNSSMVLRQQQPFNPGADMGPLSRGANQGFATGRGWPRQRGRGRDRGRGRSFVNRGNGPEMPYGAHGENLQVPHEQVVGAQFGPGGGSLGANVMSEANIGQLSGTAPNINNPPPQPVKVTGVQSDVSTAVPVEAALEGPLDSSVVGEKRKKKTRKGKQEAWCFKCCSKGHVFAECTTPLFCNICESEEHVAAKCPMKKKPKPVALAVGYAVDDLGFYHIPHDPIQPSKMDSITALIKVERGSLTEEDLRVHLKRLFCANFEWDLQAQAPDVWVAPFPSKVEFMRAINFGSTNLKNGMRLNFECFEEEEYFGHELPMVWMRVLNLPKVLRTYQVLWAVGTLFGATQKVDMISTRKNKFGRFKVAVLNPTILPTTMDCVIGTQFLNFSLK